MTRRRRHPIRRKLIPIRGRRLGQLDGVGARRPEPDAAAATALVASTATADTAATSPAATATATAVDVQCPGERPADTTATLRMAPAEASPAAHQASTATSTATTELTRRHRCRPARGFVAGTPLIAAAPGRAIKVAAEQGFGAATAADQAHQATPATAATVSPRRDPPASTSPTVPTAPATATPATGERRGTLQLPDNHRTQQRDSKARRTVAPAPGRPRWRGRQSAGARTQGDPFYGATGPQLSLIAPGANRVRFASARPQPVRLMSPP